MSVPLYDRSCEVVQAQLEPFAEDYRLTVVCGLYVPAAGKLALVRSVKAVGQELPDESLKPVQGGIEEGEDIIAAFERELAEELEVSTGGLRAVYGLPMDGAVFTSRSRHSGRPKKAFGYLCGIAKEELALTPNPDELISADWYDVPEARRVFSLQDIHPHLGGRGFRNLCFLNAVLALDLPGHRQGKA